MPSQQSNQWAITPTPIEEVPLTPQQALGQAPARGRPQRDTGRGHAPPVQDPRQVRQAPDGGGARPVAPRAQAQHVKPQDPSAPVTVSLDDWQLPEGALDPPAEQAPAPMASAGRGQSWDPVENTPAPAQVPLMGRVIKSRTPAVQPIPQPAQPARQAAPPAQPVQQVPSGWETEARAESWRPRRTHESGPQSQVGASEDYGLGHDLPSEESSSLNFELSDEGASWNRAPASYALGDDQVAGQELDLGGDVPSGSPPEFSADHTPIGYTGHDDLALQGPGDLGDASDYWEPDEPTPANRHEEVAAATVAAVRSQLEPILELMELAEDSDTILSCMVEPFLEYTTAIIAFVPRKDTVVALRASGSHLDKEAVREMSFELTNSPGFTQALKDKTLACVNVADDPMHEIIAQHLGADEPGEALVAPVVMGTRVVNLLCVHALKGRSFDALARSYYARLANEAALAFARLIKQKKK
jgi:hypothetical protein